MQTFYGSVSKFLIIQEKNTEDDDDGESKIDRSVLFDYVSPCQNDNFSPANISSTGCRRADNLLGSKNFVSSASNTNNTSSFLSTVFDKRWELFDNRAISAYHQLALLNSSLQIMEQYDDI